MVKRANPSARFSGAAQPQPPTGNNKWMDRLIGFGIISVGGALAAWLLAIPEAVQQLLAPETPLPQCAVAAHEVGHAAIANTRDWPFRVLRMEADQDRRTGKTVIVEGDPGPAMLQYLREHPRPLEALNNILLTIAGGPAMTRMAFQLREGEHGDQQTAQQIVDLFVQLHPTLKDEARTLQEMAKSRAGWILTALNPAGIIELTRRLCKQGVLTAPEIDEILQGNPLRK